jgi:fatty-acyl-CoA synthase
MALVIVKAGAQDDAAAIRRFVLGYADRGVISKYAVPDKILFVDEIDKTSVGKLDKKLLRQKYAG